VKKMIRCKMRQCPYWDERNICLNPLPAFDENGMCGYNWYKGNYKPIFSSGLENLNEKKEEFLIDVESIGKE